MVHIKKFNEGFMDVFKSKKKKLAEDHFGTKDLSKKNDENIPNVLSKPEGKFFIRPNDSETQWHVWSSAGMFGRRPTATIRKTKNNILILTIHGEDGKKVKIPSIQRGLDHLESVKKKSSDEREAKQDSWDEEID